MVTHKETFVKQKFIFNSCAKFLIDKFKIFDKILTNSGEKKK